MSAPQHVDRKTFLANLRQSRLLSEDELAPVLRQLPETDRGRVVARELVARGVLTHFQAENLLAGRNTGFVLGQYRILDQLGRGGMGRVFKAEHRTMGRTVALKVLSSRLLDSDRARELFLREVRAAAQLVHPNVVHAYDANEDGGRYYLVLEYVDGPNLDQLVRKQGPLSLGLACDYVKQAASGLQAAHGLGMVHRDVKPANILVQRRGLHENAAGLVKISDFGLARLQTTGAADAYPAGTILTRHNTVMGTPDFLSPEQARDLHRADIRSDLYSLGCTFYYLLTGQVPFPGGTAVDKLIRHSAERAAPVAASRPDVPPEVVEIVMRLLAKSPADRFQAPIELARALDPYAVSGPTPWAPPPSGPYLDAAVTPVGEADAADVDSDDVLEAGGTPSSAALVNTESPDLSTTPGYDEGDADSPLRRRRRRLLRARRRRAVLVWTAGIVLALAGVLALLMSLMNW